MERFIKKWALFLAIIIGFIIHPWVAKVAFLSPYLISLILTFTFSKLSPSDLKISKSHLVILAFQICFSALMYYTLLPYSKVVAAGCLVLILTPTATSAPALVKILGGDVTYITSYLFLCNIVMAFIFPLVISTVNEGELVDFGATVLSIFYKVGGLLVAPLTIATLIRRFAPSLNHKMVSWGRFSFYIWAITLTIVVGNTIRFFAEQQNPNYMVIGEVLAVSLFVCIVQFGVGRKFGAKCGDKFTIGQTVGQKNTILAIWIAQTFLNPLSSLVPACYVIWQNIFNGIEVFLHDKAIEKRYKQLKKTSKN